MAATQSPAPKKGRGRPFTVTDVEKVLDGTLEAQTLTGPDSKGLTLTGFSVLTAAAEARSASAKLTELLAPPTEGEADRIGQIIDLLTVIAESQVRMEGRLNSLVDALRASGSKTSGSSKGSAASMPRDLVG